MLENYEDIDRAGDFLENVVNTTEVKNLWVYDRDGKIVFGSGTPKNKLEPEDVSTLLDTKAYEAIEGAYSGDDRYWTTTYYLENDNNGTLWGVKDQWLVQVENNFSEIQKNVVQGSLTGIRCSRTFRSAGMALCWLFQKPRVPCFLILILTPKGNRLKI